MAEAGDLVILGPDAPELLLEAGDDEYDDEGDDDEEEDHD